MNKLALLAGIIVIISSYVYKKIDLYYESKILPKKTKHEQDLYWDREKKLSSMGANNVPFKDGKIIATNQNKYTFYNYCIGLGFLIVLAGLLGW